MNANGNSSAYPEQLIENRNGELMSASCYADVGGLTKREAFAMAAMQGLLANGKWFMNVVNANMGASAVGHAEAIVAEAAVMGADALLAELAKEPT